MVEPVVDNKLQARKSESGEKRRDLHVLELLNPQTT